MKIKTILLLMLFMVSLHVSADIVYHNVNPDQIILPGDTEYFIDMNGDAVNDFSIQNNVNTGAGIYNILFVCQSTGADVVGADQGGVWGVNVLSNGTNVGAGSSFSGTTAPSDAYIRTGAYTTWINQSNRFIGVKFMVGADTFYGWIRISVSGTNVVTVIDWAYNDTNGTTIAAGDIGGGGLILDANFTASAYVINAGECIDFTDISTGNPTYWEWTFAGAQTTGSLSQNPTNICYYTAGVYDVILNVQNATNTDTYTCTGCITVNAQTDLPIANFTADYVLITEGGSVNFTNTSVNGPFDEVLWAFEGGLPFNSSDENAGPISYATAGVYDVSLTVTDEDGNSDTELKLDYIKVVPLASEPPEVNFIADRTVIEPGESVNFHDLTYGNPYRWTWTFQGASTPTSEEQHPQNIQYPAEGVYTVKLVAMNNLGTDSLIRTGYIIVDDNPPCTTYPIPDFRASNRLIVSGTKVYFEDLSVNNPTNWNWYFEYGYPNYSNASNITNGIEYNYPGIFDVTLTVNNACGTNYITKNDYIYVFTGPVAQYCDTLSNIASSELITTVPVSGWGEIAGHNSQRVRMYADFYDDHSFSKIEALIVPVRTSDYASVNSYVKFYVWEGSTPYPDSILAEKKVFIKDIPDNFYSVITFNPPIEIEGPFYAGFSINYPDSDNDGISDGRFSVSVASPRNGYNAYNTLYANIGGVWYSCPQKFGFATSTDIRPVACLVDIEDIMVDLKVNIYPNPASDQVVIDMNELSFRHARIDILDITGKLIYTKEFDQSGSYTIPVDNFRAGLYFVQINADGKRITKKLSVAR